MAIWLVAGFVGLLASAGLFVGALLGYLGRLPHRAIAIVMGFGAGVLVSVLALELVIESTEHGSIAYTVIGFLVGAFVFSSVNWLLELRGAADRKRCGACVAQPTEAESPGSGLAIAVGALIDGIPESIAIGLSVVVGAGQGSTLGGASVSVALVVGFFVANVPQGLSSASGMREAGRSSTYVLGVWGGVALASGLAAVLGAALFSDAGDQFLAAITALAAGGVLAMLAETMIPEAFHRNMAFIGLVTAVGFMVAVLLGAEALT